MKSPTSTKPLSIAKVVEGVSGNHPQVCFDRGGLMGAIAVKPLTIAMVAGEAAGKYLQACTGRRVG